MTTHPISPERTISKSRRKSALFFAWRRLPVSSRVVSAFNPPPCAVAGWGYEIVVIFAVQRVGISVSTRGDWLDFDSLLCIVKYPAPGACFLTRRRWSWW